MDSVDVFAHFIIPLVLVLAIFPELPWRRVLVLSPLAWFPDLDFGYLHGILLHNIFVVGGVAGIAYFLSGRKKQVFFLALFFLSSHLVLDAHNSTQPLWPVMTQYVTINADLTIDNTTHQLIWGDKPFIELKDIKGPKTFIGQQQSYVVTTEFFLIALMALFLLALRLRGWDWGRRPV